MKFHVPGTMGIIGDLTSAEILEQLFIANRYSKIRNVVFMGMGEPLQNYEAVKRAVLFMIDDKKFALGPRHITVSTVGELYAINIVDKSSMFNDIMMFCAHRSGREHVPPH